VSLSAILLILAFIGFVLARDRLELQQDQLALNRARILDSFGPNDSGSHRLGPVPGRPTPQEVFR
jgi:hypothetical protein